MCPILSNLIHKNNVEYSKRDEKFYRRDKCFRNLTIFNKMHGEFYRVLNYCVLIRTLDTESSSSSNLESIARQIKK